MSTKPLAQADETKRSRWPVYESMGQAAADLGQRIEVLKAAKRNGCAAFLSGSRVDAKALVLYLLDEKLNAEEVIDFNKERALNMRLQNEAMEREAKEAKKELARLEVIERLLWDELLMPLKRALNSAPDVVGPLANPADPDHAKRVVIGWREPMLAAINAAEPKEVEQNESKQTS